MNLGIPHDRIIFLSSREVDPDTLVAENAAARWRKFRSHAVGAATPAFPSGNVNDWRQRVLSGAAYSGSLYRDSAEWPAVWTQHVVSQILFARLRHNFTNSRAWAASAQPCANAPQPSRLRVLAPRPLVASGVIRCIPWSRNAALGQGCQRRSARSRSAVSRLPLD